MGTPRAVCLKSARVDVRVLKLLMLLSLSFLVLLARSWANEGGLEPMASSEATPITAVLIDVSFIDGGADNGGPNHHAMLKNSATNGGWGDGEAIVNPVWVDSNGDGVPEKNDPVCYTRSSGGTETTRSRLRVQVGIKVTPAGIPFTLTGKYGPDPYFGGSGVSTGSRQVITTEGMLASKDLPTTINKLSMTFSWTVIATDPGPPLTYKTIALPNTTHTVYLVYDMPITTIFESGADYSNNLTPQRLDFSILWAAGLSDKIAICDKIVRKVSGEISGTYDDFQASEDPRWIFYNRVKPRKLDCHHRALLSALGFGQVGIFGHVRRMYSTCYPVPDSVPGRPPNSATNDYMGGYLENSKLKFRQDAQGVQVLMFVHRNWFEGCIRVDTTWWTVYPYHMSPTAKELLAGYATPLLPRWQRMSDWSIVLPTVPVPIDYLADQPDNP